MKNLNIEKLSKIGFITILLFGIYLRLDQFLVQILIDDEWHAIHQLIKSSPSRFIKTFGHADYSIPLTLLYWLEAKFFGLSELLMRWPMMLFGILTLIFFPLFVKKKFNWSLTLITAFLIATSPLLIHYSRIARPYAITLFLVYFSSIMFYKYYNNSQKPFFYGFVYAIVSSLALWLHLIVGLFLIAPFIVEFIRVLFDKRKSKVNRILKLIYLGVPTLALMLILILPPLINDMAALSSKANSDLPTTNTFIGFLYLCYGTRSTLLVVIFSVLTLIALPIIVKKSKISLNILVGFILTLLSIYIVQPAWVHNPITFTRYLLPVLPIMLFSTAIGFQYVFNIIKNKINNNRVFLSLVIVTIISIVTLMKANSPLVELMRKPNTNTLHLLYSIDFRKGKNIIEDVLIKRPVSTFWKSLNNKPLKYKIAVAPWFFESYNWDAPIWEKITQQYIIPAYLIGLCTNERKGEVPNNKRFRFRNVVYLADKYDVAGRNIDFIVFQKPIRFDYKVDNQNLGQCQKSLVDIYGKPIYEDGLIAVFDPKIEDNKIDKQ